MPENVTNLPKIEQRPSPPLIEERDVVLRKGETLETALRSYGATPGADRRDHHRPLGPDQGCGPGRRPARCGSSSPRARASAIPGRSCACIVFGERGIEGIAATNDRGVFVSVTPPADPARSAGRRRSRGRGGRGRTRRRSPLREPLRDGAQERPAPRRPWTSSSGSSATTSISSAGSRRATRFEIFFGSDDENGAPGDPLRLPDGRRRAAPGLSLPGRRRHHRFLRRVRPLPQEVPDPQAHRRRHPALGLRLALSIRSWAIRAPIRASTGPTGSAPPSSPPATARSSRRNGIPRLWPPGRAPAHQRLCDRLFPHVRLRQGHRARQAGCSRARSSAMSAIPASRRARTFTTK